MTYDGLYCSTLPLIIIGPISKVRTWRQSNEETLSCGLEEFCNEQKHIINNNVHKSCE